MSDDPARKLALEMFRAALDAAMPDKVIPGNLPPPPKGKTVIVGAGKASAAMARAFEDHWNGPLSGIVVTPYGHGVPCKNIRIVEASHPLPDAAGHEAATEILALARSLGADDLMVALISGGGSSLLSLPAPGVSLAEKRAVNQLLLHSGLPIDAMNTVRKHLSAIKGGRLAASAWPARCVSLLISDVPGDDPGMIASGPTVGDTGTLADARAVLAPFRARLPAAVVAALENPQNETCTADDPHLARSEAHLVATPLAALGAAADVARKAGYKAIILGDDIEGDASKVARDMAVRALAARDGLAGEKLALISGGETTVTLNGAVKKGCAGGRNVTFLMALALALKGAAGITALAADTDGVDGSANIAGAVIDETTLARAAACGYPLETALGANDGHGLFARLADQVITGPTLTNVNDFRVILVA